ncbi:MAG: hypothetical protein HWQ38_35970 [Nostoc sp. NMS7]|uniref:hypothetical protein n=1 Tax=Nostoc sp. NMS7 TaxID=2815391 RepID=UPI0025FAD65D|nr:hypothetical protein [Nostoc sp. NMS7]MBN3951581.1 hypothetical protein [Nostoc sp. NMS7]
MPRKRKELTPETVEKLRGLKLDTNIQSINEFRPRTFCDLAEVKRQKLEKRELARQKKKLASAKKPVEIIKKPPEEKGWTPAKIEAARQRIMINKPWLHSTGATTLLGKKISSRNSFKHGLYSKVIANSPLESVEISVTPEDGELRLDIKYTSIQENKAT